MGCHKFYDVMGSHYFCFYGVIHKLYVVVGSHKFYDVMDSQEHYPLQQEEGG